MPKFSYYLDAVSYCSKHNPPIPTALIIGDGQKGWSVQDDESVPAGMQLSSGEKASLFGASVSPACKP